MAANIKDMKPKVQRLMDKFLKQCAKEGHELLVTQGYRSKAEQDKLYAQGRTAPGSRVTNAKGGQSFHNFGVAFDVCFIRNKKAWYPAASDPLWIKLGQIAASIGLEHGDRGYKDLPHFQYRAGKTLEDFQKGKVPASLLA